MNHVDMEADSRDYIDWFNILSMVTLLLLTVCVINAMVTLLTFGSASINTHREMFKQILYAPMAFFDVNSTGMLMNNFSKDIGMLDETMLHYFMNLLVHNLYFWHYIVHNKKITIISGHFQAHFNPFYCCLC